VADKNFVVKNGLVVGSTASIAGVEIDPSGASSNQVLKFNGTKFAPAAESDISGTVYTATIGDGTNSSYTITHGFGTRNVVVIIRNASSPYEVINARWEATTTSTITIDFSSAVNSDSIVVSVYSTVTGISALTTKGDLLTRNASELTRLAVGDTAGHVLTVDSAEVTGLKWAAPVDATKIALSLVDAKGDLITATADNTPARLAVGTDDQVLMARASTATGLAYGAPRLAGGAALPLMTAGVHLDGSTGLVFGGLAYNVATTPDSAALSITGDIDIKVYATMTDWTPTAESPLVSKYGETSTRSYVFALLTNGTLRIRTTSNGTLASQVESVSSVATGITDGTSKWVRVTLDVDNGSSQRVAKFYTSDDGTSWTQLGTTVTTAGTTSIFDGPDELAIGSMTNYGGGAQVTGTIGRVIIQSGFDNADNTSNLRFDANFATQTANALAFTESSSNAATVSITTSRYTYGLPDHSFYTRTTFALTANFQYYIPFKVTQPITVDMIYFRVTTAPSSTATVRTGIYAADNNFQPSGAPIVDAGNTTVSTSSNTNYFTQFSPVTLQPGVYLATINTSVAFTVQAYPGGYMAFTPTANDFMQVLRVSQTQAALPTPGTKWNSINSGASPNLNLLLLRFGAA